MKILIVLFYILTFQSLVLFQSNETGKDSPRYPNELKGFELMQTSKLKNLIPGVTTAGELKSAEKLLGDDCRLEDTGRCVLDENWDVAFEQIDSREGFILAAVKFYPRKRISFSKTEFPRQFSKSEMGIVHLKEINAEKFISYHDRYGLSYVLVNEATDKYYKKGDLFFIEYGIPEVETK